MPRSLFKKQTAREAHGADYGTTGQPGRAKPEPPTGGRARWRAPAGASRDLLFRKNTLDEMTVRRTEQPVEGAKPVKREQIGIGSYEDPSEVKRKGRSKNKTGRPGH